MSSAIDESRRRFLYGQLRASLVIRPPWALAEAQFAATCTRCDDCARACAEGIVRRGSGGFPEVDFRRGSCVFCRDCATACKSGAIQRDQPISAAWQQRALVGNGCLAARGTVCRACADSCEGGAISFRLALGGRSYPRIQTQRCTGCGACLTVCPVQAVSLQQLEIRT